jgi:hypothetical protein
LRHVANHARTVELERFQVQCALVAKGSVKAAAAQAQRLNQVFNRRRRVALAPEKLQSLDEYLITVERFGAGDLSPIILTRSFIVLIVPEFVKD